MTQAARKLDASYSSVTRPHLARPTRRRLEPLRIVAPQAHRTPSSAAERVIRESLRTAMAPPVVEGLLEALQTESGAPVPSAGEPLEAFVQGPLASALQRTIGPVSTAFVIRELRELLQEVLPSRDGGATGERPSRISEIRIQPRPTPLEDDAPAAPRRALPSSSGPVVMVVSKDAWLLGRLSRELEGRAVVRAVKDAWSLVEALDTPASRPPLVLWDCRKNELGNLAASAQAATKGPVVLFGTDSERELPIEDREHTQIVTCSRVASPGDLAALSRVMLGIS